MKKLFGLLALVLAVVSCQNDFDGANVGGDEVAVTLNVAVPDDATRAAGEDSALSGLQNIDLENGYDIRYILEVYDAKDNLAKPRIVNREDVSASTSFDLRLVPGRDYRFVVWADFIPQDQVGDGDFHYNTTNIQAISLIEGRQNANDESRDAYTCVRLVEKFQSGAPVEIELKRPFAKLRVVTTDMNHLYSDLMSVKVTYTTPLYTTFNALTGEKDGLQSVASTTKVVNLTADFKYTNEVDYKTNGKMTLFADYFFGAKDDAIHFTLDATDATGMDIPEVYFNTNIPVQRNYLTTVMGPVLTDAANVTVRIEDTFAGTHNVDVVEASNASDLQEAIDGAAAGKETHIVLGGNINLNDLLSAGILSTRAAEPAYGLVIPAGKEVTLNLNGKTLFQEKACSDHYSMILNNGNLTITGEGTVEFENTSEGGSSDWGTYTIENRGEAVLTIDNATIRHNGCVNGETNHDTNIAIQNYEGKVVINDGTIASPEFRSLRDFTAGGEIIINGGTFLGQVWMQGLGNGSSSLTINGGSFSPDAGGYDGSSVYITNSANVVNVAITGGIFNTKVGCFDPNKEGANGCITGGTFTTAAKEATSEELLANGYAFVEGENGTYTVENVGHYTDANGNYHITGVNGWLWMADQNDTFFRNKTVYLDNDIDFAGVDMRVTKMFTPEYSATFDGQNHTINNVRMASAYDQNNQALFDGLMTVKNLTVENSHVYGMSQVGIIGANIFGSIENCHVKNCRSYGYVHHVGGIVGLHSWGEIKNCSIENTSIECYYYGAVGAIAGAMNEVSRNITGCSVKGCRLIKEGPEGVYPDWDPCFGIAVGYAYAPGTYVFNVEVENNTIKGVASEQMYGEVATGSTITVNGVQL
ncbi:MAG: FimB/Mfa2 family fimbrial subunit [Alistipes sp.]|nr:FimB/Mfa2 family fimbrial subunit [Alistipes sp.]